MGNHFFFLPYRKFLISLLSVCLFWPSFCLLVCLQDFLIICLYVCLSPSLPDYLFVRLSACLSVPCLHVCLSVLSMLACLPVCTMPSCLSVCLLFCLSARPFAYLNACLSVWMKTNSLFCKKKNKLWKGKVTSLMKTYFYRVSSQFLSVNVLSDRTSLSAHLCDIRPFIQPPVTGVILFWPRSRTGHSYHFALLCW